MFIQSYSIKTKIKRLNQTNYRYTYEMKAYDENCMAIDPHESPEKVSYYKTEIYRVANNQYTNFGTIYSSPNHDGMIFHESYNKENGRNYILQNTVSNDIASRNFAREISTPCGQNL